MGAIFCFCPHILTEIILVFGEQTGIPNSALFPIQVPLKHHPTVSPAQVAVRTNFVQEVPLDLQCLTMILATCVVEDVSL